MKTRILLSGCSGKMGHAVSALVEERDNCEICAGIDLSSTGHEGYPVYSSIFDFPGEADVLIDFSHPSVLASLLEYGKQHHLPLVLCTTGYSKEQTESVRAASAELPVFSSGNMSLGINLLIELSKKAAQVLRRLVGSGTARFRQLFSGNRSRSEIVATFLALLELCRMKSVRIEEESDGETTVTFLQMPKEQMTKEAEE